MKYTSYPHYFAERVDQVLESRNKFRELYLSYKEEERRKFLSDLYITSPILEIELTFGTDSAIVNPSDEEIDMIWWELIKNSCREIVYSKDIPDGISMIVRNFLLRDNYFRSPIYAITADGLFDYPEKYRCDERKDRNRKRGNSKKK